jgi:glutathione S-transferase
MKLLYNPLSPFARMCRITARELGIEDELEIVVVEGMSPAIARPEVVSHNPIGRIPTLITDHGHSIYDSRVICEYLTHHAGDKRLLPDEPVRRFRILTLQALGQGIAEAAVALRYELAARPEQSRWPQMMDRQRTRILAACDDIEKRWAGELHSTTLATIALAAALAYVSFRHGDLDWRTHRPSLAQWFEEFSAKPSMKDD